MIMLFIVHNATMPAPGKQKGEFSIWYIWMMLLVVTTDREYIENMVAMSLSVFKKQHSPNQVHSILQKSWSLWSQLSLF